MSKRLGWRLDKWSTSKEGMMARLKVDSRLKQSTVRRLSLEGLRKIRVTPLSLRRRLDFKSRNCVEVLLRRTRSSART